MKQTLIAAFLVSCLIAARIAPDHSKAEVNQVQGLFIFTDSKPVKEYKYLGTVTNGFHVAGSSQYQPVRDKLLKKLKKDYPQANGAIFYFNNGTADKCDAIRFSE